MNSGKTENEQLENLLSEYFKKRSFYKNDKPPSQEENKIVHQKYNKPTDSIFEFKAYCSMTSLHGFVHFVQNNLNKYEKCVWAICLIAIYILCGMLIYMLIFMFWEMPAIISLDNSVSSIWTIPFPAVTVCSSNRIRPSVYNYADVTNTDYDDQIVRNTMHSICERNPMKKKLKLTEEYLDGPFISQTLKNLSFPCKDVIKAFYWILVPENHPCELWFQETFTSYGLCYSFNMMPMSDLLNGVDEWSQEDNYGWKNYQSSWQPDTGYTNNPLDYNLPMRTFGDSDYHSATMILDLHTEDFNRECAQGLDVFYILIHSPAEWPDRTHPTLLVNTNSLETISVRPLMLTTSSDLTSWDPHIRKCYFQNERKLKFFKVYTQKNCIFECRSSSILEACGCVPFYHLSTTGLKNTPVCGPAKMSCWVVASKAETKSCGCLPGCSEFQFRISAMNAQYNKTYSADKGASMSSSVLLSVYYQSKNYIGINRIMTFTFGEFMGNIGGILGLCLGFSILSLVEIIYFLTLRPLVNYYNLRRKMKKVEPIREAIKHQNSFVR